MRPDRFEGQTVLVTGSSRGIGASTAIAFAAEGARVAVNYRRDEPGAVATRQAIVDAGRTAEVFQADIGNEVDVARLAREVESSLGPVSILVNNAALIDRSSMFELSLEAFDTVWHANVRGLLQLSQLVAPGMVERGTGAIVHVSSILARLGVMNRSAYIASKGAVEGLTRAMALELGPKGVRVNAVAPGLIATEALLAGMRDEAVQTAVQRHVPEGRFGRPDEITAAILFAASSEASYLNGAVIGVDGALGARESTPA